jgi:hypothetical protein
MKQGKYILAAALVLAAFSAGFAAGSMAEKHRQNVLKEPKTADPYDKDLKTYENKEEKCCCE